ncbi:MAG TPA: SDR family oxidoreductase [Solirubrobacterales bacterium]|jgi:NAD(P)-dependent dehydrogenase (short-subunit alcohol dehydrogenase family)
MAAQEIGTVIITGAASGLGEAIAQGVEREGGTPVSLDLRQADGFESELVDLADTVAAEAATRAVIERHGGLDAVVAAAGTDVCGPLDGVAGADWNRVVQVNLMGTAAVVRAALPALEQGHGRVVTVASTLGIRGLPDATAYCASKFGVVGFSRALAAETAGRIGVTLLMPGGMETAFFDGREEKYKPPPDARLAPPGEVAEAALFALSRPPAVELREALVCPPTESSWP